MRCASLSAPSNSCRSINDHLGDAYWRVGRKLEATFQWNRALANDPDENLIPEIARKLTDGLPALDPAIPATANGARRDDNPALADPGTAGGDKKGDLGLGQATGVAAG